MIVVAIEFVDDWVVTAVIASNTFTVSTIFINIIRCFGKKWHKLTATIAAVCILPLPSTLMLLLLLMVLIILLLMYLLSAILCDRMLLLWQRHISTLIEMHIWRLGAIFSRRWILIRRLFRCHLLCFGHGSHIRWSVNHFQWKKMHNIST